MEPRVPPLSAAVSVNVIVRDPCTELSSKVVSGPFDRPGSVRLETLSLKVTALGPVRPFKSADEAPDPNVIE